jgi:hypothetical protein
MNHHHRANIRRRRAHLAFVGMLLAVFLCFQGAGRLAASLSLSRLPETPFAAVRYYHFMYLGEDCYRFSYWENLGGFPLGGAANSQGKGSPAKNKPEEILVMLNFNPASEYDSPLGKGWTLPLFDSRLEWESTPQTVKNFAARGAGFLGLPHLERGNAKTFKAYLPDGRIEKFKRVKNADSWHGSEWTAIISGRQVVLKTSRGWVLTYGGDNRLLHILTPSGDFLESHVSSDGARSLVSGNKTLLSLKPDRDKATAQKIYHLNFAGKSALIKMGKRSVSVEKKGRLGKQAEIETMASIQFKDGPEKHFVFKQDELTVAGHLYKWEPGTHLILQSGATKYAHPVIWGVPCFKATNPDGETTMRGEKKWGNVKVQQDGTGPVIITEHTQIRHQSKVKKIFEQTPARGVVLLREYWYDNKNGDIVQKFINDENGGIFYGRSENEVFAKRENDGANLWTKKFNAQGQIIEFQHGARRFNFEYLSGGKVKIIFTNGDEKIETFHEASEVAPLTGETFL